jgi:hypothetical protein
MGYIAVVHLKAGLTAICSSTIFSISLLPDICWYFHISKLVADHVIDLLLRRNSWSYLKRRAHAAKTWSEIAKASTWASPDQHSKMKPQFKGPDPAASLLAAVYTDDKCFTKLETEKYYLLKWH